MKYKIDRQRATEILHRYYHRVFDSSVEESLKTISEEQTEQELLDSAVLLQSVLDRPTLNELEEFIQDEIDKLFSGDIA